MTHPLVTDVVSALASDKNVLLYGPPGTGKTWLVSEVVAYFRNRRAGGGQPTLIIGSAEDQFGTSLGPSGAGMPTEIDIEWVTFHQSYSYEEFILGRRPMPEAGGIVLEPHFGLLMSIAIRIERSGAADACLLVIDELNRANTGQVFGEFITLLDPEYRRTIRDVANPRALPVRLPGIAYENGASEEIRMLRDGGVHSLPEDWSFPEHVYVLATMNSVDKAALPLDSALMRRFHRIETRPSTEILAERLTVDLDALAAKAQAVRSGDHNIDGMTAEETAILLLDRINVAIAGDMGDDFEIGHSLLWGVVSSDPADRWTALRRAWDRALFPQIIERYAGRNEALRDLLKIAAGSGTEAAFQERRTIGSDVPTEAALHLRPLLSLGEAEAKGVLRHLAL